MLSDCHTRVATESSLEEDELSLECWDELFLEEDGFSLEESELSLEKDECSVEEGELSLEKDEFSVEQGGLSRLECWVEASAEVVLLSMIDLQVDLECAWEEDALVLLLVLEAVVLEDALVFLLLVREDVGTSFSRSEVIICVTFFPSSVSSVTVMSCSAVLSSLVRRESSPCSEGLPSLVSRESSPCLRQNSFLGP